jgi:hypothetical protein
MQITYSKSMEFIESKKGSLLALGGIYLLGVFVTLVLVTRTAYGPIHFGDEVRYWTAARNLAAGEYTILGNLKHPPVYPISLLPAFVLFSGSQTYVVAKLLNAIYLTSAVFPIYLLARKLCGNGISLLVALLALFNPLQVVIPRSIISENVFYPLFMWCVYFAFANVYPAQSRRRYLENAIFGALLGLLFLTRYIALAVIPALLIIWWLKPIDHEPGPFLCSKKKIRHALGLVIPLGVVMAIWLQLGVREHIPLKGMLGFGIASNPNPAQLSLARLWMWFILYLGYAVLIAAPFLGVLCPAMLRFRPKEWRGDTTRWLISVALICIFFLIACTRHSWRAAYNYPEAVKIQGRYILTFGPLFLISAFAVLKNYTPSRSARIWHGLALILSGGGIVLAYMTLHHGSFFNITSRLKASASSPDGFLVECIGSAAFLAFSLVALLATTWCMSKNRRLAYVSLALALVAYYGHGDVCVYRSRLRRAQTNNFMAHELIRSADLHRAAAGAGTTAVQLGFHARAGKSVRRQVVSTFQFNGFYNVGVAVMEPPAGDRRRTVMTATIGNDRFAVYALRKAGIKTVDSHPFEFDGTYFAVDRLGSPP